MYKFLICLSETVEIEMNGESVMLIDGMCFEKSVMLIEGVF